MSEHKLSRKDFMNIVWGAAGLLAVTELSLVGLRPLRENLAECSNWDIMINFQKAV
jgi:hypothetical protein